ncbi:hypothetical protein ACN38_g7865 [Penicillium nordicum]|uniref:Uncharacterized protein n=1 Tax=Penicillium nordicum TaxID=229535 RepID=A0A0M9WE03_9EURO|nr:hypothetical protein ACN38_g7865 [Penicillium nordicum]
MFLISIRSNPEGDLPKSDLCLCGRSQSVSQPRPPLIEAIQRQESDGRAPGYGGEATHYRREPGKLADYGTVQFRRALSSFARPHQGLHAVAPKATFCACSQV